MVPDASAYGQANTSHTLLLRCVYLQTSGGCLPCSRINQCVACCFLLAGFFTSGGGALLRVFAPIPSPHSSAFAAVPSADARPINTTTPCYCVSSFCKHLRGVGHTLSKVEDERSRSFVQGMPRTRPPVTGLLREKLLLAGIVTKVSPLIKLCGFERPWARPLGTSSSLFSWLHAQPWSTQCAPRHTAPARYLYPAYRTPGADRASGLEGV